MTRKPNIKTYPDTIIIERMYAGEYLENNIGHEIINTFKTDIGENYIYISPWGFINSEYRNTKYVLLVRLINQHCFEVLGYAGDLSLLLSEDSLKKNNQKKAGVIDSELQATIIEKNSIKYGGVKINDLLAEQENTVFVTFKAETYRAVSKQNKLYIVDQLELADDCHIWIPGINFSKTSLHMYCDAHKKSDAFKTLNQMVETSSYWEDSNTAEKIDLGEPENGGMGILDIIGKTDDELAHSNWMAYYLKNDTKLMEAFASMLLGTKEYLCELRLIREYHNIDLWIENREHVIVIENKIKSGINGVDQERHDIKSNGVASQLSKYIDFAEEEAYKDGKEREPHFFIFLPDYSYKDEDLSPFLHHDKYRIIRYRELSDFFESHSCNLPYYDDFKKALRKHATEYKKDLYEIMKDRFTTEIKAHLQFEMEKT